MRIIYTKHAGKKFQDLANLGVKITKTKIREAITHPLHINEVSDYPKKIVSGELDIDHVLRVVYKVDHDIITIITFYPAKKRRYFS